jgi:phosphoribosylamine--glycine ligase
MKLLIVGNGAREHAFAWRLKKSPKVSELFAAPGNAGIAALATCVPIDSSSIIELGDFARQAHIDLTVVGPELPLALGVADEFQKRGLRIFAPSQAAAELEASKVFAKRFLRAHDIPTADFEVCESAEEAEECLARRGDRYPVVVKADGLAGGKGVTVAGNREEAVAAIHRVMVERIHGNAGNRVVVEDHLEGTELSFQVITDGRVALPLASARDYKRVGDGDQGPNTGGMGAVSPARALTPELGGTILKTVVAPTLAGLEKDGRRFLGVLYCGLMLTPSGPMVLEYNVRAGDPETQSVLPRLESDLAAVLLAAVEGHLEGVKLEWRKEVSVSVVLAAGGYPASFKRGQVITGIHEAEQLGVRVFHAGTALENDQLVTSAGRVLTVNALAPSRARAQELAYKAVDRIHFQGMHCRRDIGGGEESTSSRSPE